MIDQSVNLDQYESLRQYINTGPSMSLEQYKNARMKLLEIGAIPERARRERMAESEMRELRAKIEKIELVDAEKKQRAADHERLKFIEKRISSQKELYELRDGSGKPIMYSEAIQLLKNSPSFREAIINILKDSRFESYYLQCCPVNARTVNNTPFKFILKNKPSLHIKPADISQYQDKLQKKGPIIASFRSLKNAMLVCPHLNPAIPGKRLTNYRSLASFSRSAQMEQQHNLWQEVGIQAEKAIKASDQENMIYLHTSGKTVYWLHIKLEANVERNYHHFEQNNEDEFSLRLQP